MSTEHQRYSTFHQKAAIGAYAAERGYEIVRTYADEGISGLTFEKRPGLKAMIAEIVAGQSAFATVLVFDVSRWGRFQNLDESAHYEFLCAAAGVAVEYCAEPFDNDGSFVASMQKWLKRMMAAQYSQDLSVKLSAVRRRNCELGFWQGGPAPYGLRRRIVAADGTLGPVLERGERKALQGHRIILVPGPAREVTLVNRIFRIYAMRVLSACGIAQLLNDEGEPAPGGGPWTETRVFSLLACRAYVGDLVFNTGRRPLGGRYVAQPREDWREVRGAFQPIVPRTLFEAAASVRGAYNPGVSDDQILAVVRAVQEKYGAVTMGRLLAAAPRGLRHALKRYGGLRLACEAVGTRLIRTANRHIVPKDEATALALLAGLYARHGYLSRALIDQDPALPSARYYNQRWGLIRAYAAVGFKPCDEAAWGAAANPGLFLGAAVRRAQDLAKQRASCAPGELSAP